MRAGNTNIRWGAWAALALVLALTVAVTSGCPKYLCIERMQHFSDTLETRGLEEDIEGKVALVVFWTRMSTQCTDLLAELHELQVKYKDKGFVVITVNQDGPDSAAAVTSTLQQYHIDLVILHDGGKISDEFRVEGLPAAYLFSRDHVLIDQKEIDTDDMAALEAQIAKALNGKE